MLVTVAMMVSSDPSEERTELNIPWIKPLDHIELKEQLLTSFI